MIPPEEMFEYEQRTLQALRLSASHRTDFGRYVLDSLKVNAEMTADALVARLEGFALAHRIAKRTVSDTAVLTVDVPTTWWQMWKKEHAETWWAGWIARRWPAVHRTIVRHETLTVTVDVHAIYTQADVDYLAPDEPFGFPRPVSYMVSKQRSGW
jgi:hypothetical protein